MCFCILTIYKMNIIGVPGDKSPNMGNDNGKRIFVPIDDKCKIMLEEGDFDIIDANGTDGTATFMLPNPDPGNTGTTEYSVFVRELGTPGGSATMTTCATAIIGGVETEVCSIYPLNLIRMTGKSSFRNVSKELLPCTAFQMGS